MPSFPKFGFTMKKLYEYQFCTVDGLRLFQKPCIIRGYVAFEYFTQTDQRKWLNVCQYNIQTIDGTEDSYQDYYLYVTNYFFQFFGTSIARKLLLDFYGSLLLLQSIYWTYQQVIFTAQWSGNQFSPYATCKFLTFKSVCNDKVILNQFEEYS